MSNLTFSIEGRFITAYGENEVYALATLTNSYPNGAQKGWPLTPANFLLNSFAAFPGNTGKYILPKVKSNGVSGYFCDVDSSGNLRVLQSPAVPAQSLTAVTGSNFAASSGWGTSPTLSPSAASNQGAFALTITAQATTGANPTITLTFPTPYSTAPTFVCSRGDSLADVGYFVVTSTSTTTAVFTFIGTPTATHVYVLDAVAQTLGGGASASTLSEVANGTNLSSVIIELVAVGH